MHQRGLHLWDLDMSWASEEIQGHTGETGKACLRPSFPPALSAFLFCHEGWNRIFENYSISQTQRIPSQFVSGGSKIDGPYYLKRQITALLQTTTPAPPRLHLHTHPPTFPFGQKLTIPIVKWQQDDTATSDCFAHFKHSSISLLRVAVI